jgi:hypothetical protein
LIVFIQDWWTWIVKNITVCMEKSILN